MLIDLLKMVIVHSYVSLPEGMCIGCVCLCVCVRACVRMCVCVQNSVYRYCMVLYHWENLPGNSIMVIHPAKR